MSERARTANGDGTNKYGGRWEAGGGITVLMVLAFLDRTLAFASRLPASPKKP